LPKFASVVCVSGVENALTDGLKLPNAVSFSSTSGVETMARVPWKVG